MSKICRYFLIINLLIVFPDCNINAQIPCENGVAGGYPCDKVDLIARVSPADLLAEEHQGNWLNDLWGWTDPETGKEYALVGMSNGTSFVDISDPVMPVVLGVLPEHHAATAAQAAGSSRLSHNEGKSAWRDIKVYKNHAFIVSEDASHGMQVFDLTQLRNVESPPVVFSETANYEDVGNAHNIVINEESGFAYAVGATQGGKVCSGGGLHIINIQDPANPVYAGCFDKAGYTHDAQCVIYYGPDERYYGKEICFNANVNTVDVVDVTDKANSKRIGAQSYSDAQYTHQGWLTEDHRYFISNDELDEYEGIVKNTRTMIWDMQDLEYPKLIGYYYSDLNVIDHNLYVKDALVYQANYTAGLRILNISDISNANFEEIAFFDTYPLDQETAFNGAWSNYPFFESGVVIVSDRQNGLFILKPQLGLLSGEVKDVYACEGISTTFKAHPNRFDLDFQWQVKQDNEFVDLVENETYSNVTTPQLTVNNVAPYMRGNTYRVEVRAPGELPYYSDDAKLMLEGLPVANFDYELIDDGVVQFINQSEKASKYYWYLENNTTSEKENPVYRYEPGVESVQVYLYAINDCEYVYSSKTIYPYSNPLGLEENEGLRDFQVYPNPADDLLSIESKNLLEKVRSIGLYTLGGQQVLEQAVVNLENASAHKIDVSDLPPGLYLLKVQTSDNTINRRVMIQ